MAFKRRSDWGTTEEHIKQLKEKLDNMPTVEELFGGSKPKGPKVVNLKNVGDFVKGVITEIDRKAPVFEWDTANNKIGFQKFWVDGKPKGVPKEEAERSGLDPVHQIMITVSPFVGQGDFTAQATDTVRIPFNSKDERDGLKNAVAEHGGVELGDTIGKRLAERNGNRKTHEIKIVPQEK